MKPHFQVQTDIVELRQGWVEQRVERVTGNTFKLYQIREQLKQCKVRWEDHNFKHCDSDCDRLAGVSWMTFLAHINI